MKKFCVISLIWMMLMVCGFTEYANALSIEYSDALIDKDGLLWLSPTFSYGISYLSMYEKIRPDNDNEFTGLRFATFREVDSLAAAYGDFGPGYNNTISRQSEIEKFLDDFESGPSFHIDAYVGAPVDGNPMLTLMDSIENPIFYSSGVEIRYLRDVWPMSLDGENYFPNWTTRGWWLVAQGPAPIPEPSSIILFGSGILGMLAYRKRRRG